MGVMGPNPLTGGLVGWVVWALAAKLAESATRSAMAMRGVMRR
jgi:hypothetical protein